MVPTNVVVPDYDIDKNDLGCRDILPSSFSGGIWHMRQLFKLLCLLFINFGKPSLFITVTCNYKWPEILRELSAVQTLHAILEIINCFL